MSIFDSRTTDLHVYEDDQGQNAILLRAQDDEWPIATLGDDMDWESLKERGFEPSGLLTGTATHVRMDTEHGGDRWAHHVFRVQMRYQRRRMQATFRVGTGWTQAPSVQDVLEGMVSDYRLTEYESADSLGYDPERAAQVERAIDAQTARLRRFLNL